MEKLIEEFKTKMFLDGKSERTVEVYSNSVKDFFKWFYDSYGNVGYKKLYRENILEYKSYLKNIKKSLHSGNNLCPKSINSELSALICFNELMEPDNIVVSKRDLIKIQMLDTERATRDSSVVHGKVDYLVALMGQYFKEISKAT